MRLVFYYPTDVRDATGSSSFAKNAEPNDTIRSLTDAALRDIGLTPENYRCMDIYGREYQTDIPIGGLRVYQGMSLYFENKNLPRKGEAPTDYARRIFETSQNTNTASSFLPTQKTINDKEKKVIQQQQIVVKCVFSKSLFDLISSSYLQQQTDSLPLQLFAENTDPSKVTIPILLERFLLTQNLTEICVFIPQLPNPLTYNDYKNKTLRDLGVNSNCVLRFVTSLELNDINSEKETHEPSLKNKNDSNNINISKTDNTSNRSTEKYREQKTTENKAQEGNIKILTEEEQKSLIEKREQLNKLAQQLKGSTLPSDIEMAAKLSKKAAKITERIEDSENAKKLEEARRLAALLIDSSDEDSDGDTNDKGETFRQKNLETKLSTNINNNENSDNEVAQEEKQQSKIVETANLDQEEDELAKILRLKESGRPINRPPKTLEQDEDDEKITLESALELMRAEYMLANLANSPILNPMLNPMLNPALIQAQRQLIEDEATPQSKNKMGTFADISPKENKCSYHNREKKRDLGSKINRAQEANAASSEYRDWSSTNGHKLCNSNENVINSNNNCAASTNNSNDSSDIKEPNPFELTPGEYNKMMKEDKEWEKRMGTGMLLTREAAEILAKERAQLKAQLKVKLILARRYKKSTIFGILNVPTTTTISDFHDMAIGEIMQYILQHADIEEDLLAEIASCIVMKIDAPNAVDSARRTPFNRTLQTTSITLNKDSKDTLWKISAEGNCVVEVEFTVDYILQLILQL